VIVARSVVIATGADYQRLPLAGLEDYEGMTVFYAAGPAEGRACAGTRVGVVGGGNSAGQAAVWLARAGALVTLLHRRASLRETMSDYLIAELDREGVAVRDRSEVTEVHGADGELEAVTLKDGERLAFGSLFCFLGAASCTDWLGDTLARDETASSSPVTRLAPPVCTRPASPASTPPATSARARPSAPRPRSVKEPRSCATSTNTWRRFRLRRLRSRQIANELVISLVTVGHGLTCSTSPSGICRKRVPSSRNEPTSAVHMNR
jgi:hypothetical protein